MAVMGPGPDEPEQELPQAWTDVLASLPIPSAIVTDTGHMVLANRWIDAEPHQRFLEPDDLRPGIRLGIDGDSRWRVRSLNPAGSILLATGEQLGAGDHLLRKFFATGDALYAVYDQQGRIVESNNAWQRVLGYTADDLIGVESWSFLPDEDQDMRAVVEKDLRERGRSEPSWRMRAADGTYRVIQWVLHFDVSTGRCFAVGRDVSDDTQRRDELHRRAYTDELTGLANRARTVAELDRHLLSGSDPAVLFCDLDNFKLVNDSLGHSAGDRLLAALGERLANRLDGRGCMVGRLGGDEFAVVVESGGEAAAINAANTIFRLIEPEFTVMGRSIRVGMSIGIALAKPGGGARAEELFERADIAVYEAKATGRNRSVVFGPELQRQVERRFHLEADLRHALATDEFEAWYQPIVDLPSGRLRGAEALLRWRRSDGSIAAPGAFLDVAIESGLIGDIGRQVMVQALHFIGHNPSPRRDLRLTINATSTELVSDDFADWFLLQAARSGARPEDVVIEITESTALAAAECLEVLERLRLAGVSIALDDFGTGYSSLAHLRTLPIDLVKIDRSFVNDLVDDPTTRAMTRSLVELCQALDLEVILEGVETVPQLDAVCEAGGRLAQGFLFHKPMPPHELRRLIAGLGHPVPAAG